MNGPTLYERWESGWRFFHPVVIQVRQSGQWWATKGYTLGVRRFPTHAEAIAYATTQPAIDNWIGDE